MFENANGIVLRTRRLTESSLIVNWLTAGSGRISTVAKGALRPKSPFGGKLDLFYVSEFSFSRSRRSDLHTLREVRLLRMHPLLRTELSALQQAAYCAALIEQTTEADTPLPGVYELMLGLLDALQASSVAGRFTASPAPIFAFEIRLLEFLGLEPDWPETRLSVETKEAVDQLKNASWTQVGRVTMNRQPAIEISRFLHGFLIYNFGRLAKGRDAALAHLGRDPFHRIPNIEARGGTGPSHPS
jgi:DNA repair protein RecO (recombination protein O)